MTRRVLAAVWRTGGHCSSALPVIDGTLRFR
jgi:hypothetical protein